MIGVLALLVAMPPSAEGGAHQILSAEPLTSLSEDREPHLVPALHERGKKETWLREKAFRPVVRIKDASLVPLRPRKDSRSKITKSADAEVEARLGEPMLPVGTRLEPITTLYNVWNREALPLIAGLAYRRPFEIFLRDRYTHQWIQADVRLANLMAAAAAKFRAPKVEVISGYRSPKYNLMLRKKGRQVARESQHTLGAAVDFRIRGVSTDALREFVSGLRLGGVGYYPRTRFIHADTGKVRYWKGS